MSYYYCDYTQPWDQRPGDVPGPNNRLERVSMQDLDSSLPGPLLFGGWHFRAWLPTAGFYGVDPYYLYAPDGTLVGRWDTEPSYSDLYDAYQSWGRTHG